MLIIGIDPGTIRMGYALIERLPTPRLIEAGVIRAKETRPIAERLELIQSQLDRILGEHAIERAAMEHAYVGKNPQSAIAIGMAQGIALASLARRRITCERIMVPKLRQRFGGGLKAGKGFAAAAVERVLGISVHGAPEDAVDAMLLACGCELGRVG